MRKPRQLSMPFGFRQRARWALAAVAFSLWAGWRWARRQATRVACQLAGRHADGSPAWHPIPEGLTPRRGGFRTVRVYSCRHCGAVAVRRGHTRAGVRAVREALRREGHHV